MTHYYMTHGTIVNVLSEPKLKILTTKKLAHDQLVPFCCILSYIHVTTRHRSQYGDFYLVTSLFDVGLYGIYIEGW